MGYDSITTFVQKIASWWRRFLQLIFRSLSPNNWKNPFHDYIWRNLTIFFNKNVELVGNEFRGGSDEIILHNKKDDVFKIVPFPGNCNLQVG